ncbi:MAG: hypothetical protein AB1490_26795 [Pseudomonadota bacterium]
MAQPHYFQQNAETCLASAQSATDETERTLWLMRAERWLRLAREASSKADDEPLTPYLVAELEKSKEAVLAPSDEKVSAAKATKAKVA